MSEHKKDNSQFGQEYGTILIVDDIPDNLRLLSNILSAQGHEVWPALSGRIALETLKRRQPDLIILDISMPDMDGFEVCRTMKADILLCRIPVIFLSAFSEIEDKIESFRVGGVDFISKPFYEVEVLARVNTHLVLKRLQEKTEKELQQSKNKYQEIFNVSNEAIIIHDALSGRITDVNRTVLEISGYRREEFINAEAGVFSQGDPPYTQQEFMRLFRLTQGHESKIFEWQIRKKNGTIAFVEVSLQKTVIEDKEVVILIGREIGERKKAEKELLQQKTLLESIFNSVPDAMVIADTNRRIILSNPGVTKVFGYTSEEILGQETKIFYESDEEFERQGKLRFNLSAEEKIEPYEVQYKRINGETFPAETIGTIIRTKDGEMVGFMELMRDISARKAAVEAIRKNEELLKEAQKIAHIGHWELDLIDGQLLWSEEVYSIFGIEKEKFGANYEAFLDLVHPADRAAVDKTYPDSVKNKTPYDTIHRIITKDKKIKYLHEMCRTEYDKTGDPVRSIGTVQDITQLKEAELEKEKLTAQLLQAQKMESIGTLAGGIAHDFNNILAAILGYGEMVLDVFPEESSVREDQQQVLIAATRAKDLVKQILAFSRQTEHQFIHVKTHHIVKEAIALLQASLPANIEIMQDIDVDSSFILADPTQIQQVVMNLCTNAYHAMRKTSGTLGIVLKEVDIGSKNIELDLGPGRYIRLEVSDTGHGMEKETQARIFDPYYTTKAKGDGTGLGLAVVHGIVKAHGGGITVNSKQGEGTVFQAFFPRVEVDGEKHYSANTKDVPGGDEHLLLIDDDESLVKVQNRILEKMGYRTTLFTKSRDALEEFRKSAEDFDLVITDMLMPKMTGAELSCEILKIQPDTKIILCTGFSDMIDEEQAKSLGIRKYVMKPVVTRDLLCIVREVLDAKT